MLEKIVNLPTKIKATAAALATVAGLSLLPGCSTSMGNLHPSVTPTAIPTVTPTQTPSPMCTQLPVGQVSQYDGHPLSIYSVASGTPGAAKLVFGGTCQWINADNTPVPYTINGQGYSARVSSVNASSTPNTADFCIQRN